MEKILTGRPTLTVDDAFSLGLAKLILVVCRRFLSFIPSALDKDLMFLYHMDVGFKVKCHKLGGNPCQAFHTTNSFYGFSGNWFIFSFCCSRG